MSRILQAGEYGYGILIENDAGYISPELNNGLLFETFNTKIDEPILINCVLQKWGVENRNGRIYPKEVLVPQVNEYMKLIQSDSAISEADHPDSSVISLQNVSHKIVKMWWGKGDEENVLFGQIKLIVTPGFLKYGVVSVVGDKILLYLQNNIKIGISSRGVGSLKQVNGKNIVQNDFELIGFDLVATPSTPGAYLSPIKSIEFNEEYQKNKNSQLLNNNDLIFDKKSDIIIHNAINNFLS